MKINKLHQVNISGLRRQHSLLHDLLPSSAALKTPFGQCVFVSSVIEINTSTAQKGVHSLGVLLLGIAASDAALLLSALLVFPPLHYCDKANVREGKAPSSLPPETGAAHVFHS